MGGADERKIIHKQITVDIRNSITFDLKAAEAEEIIEPTVEAAAAEEVLDIMEYMLMAEQVEEADRDITEQGITTPPMAQEEEPGDTPRAPVMRTVCTPVREDTAVSRAKTNCMPREETHRTGIEAKIPLGREETIQEVVVSTGSWC